MKEFRAFVPIVIIFVVTTLIFVLVPSLDFLWNMNKIVMIAGNAVLFVATFISFYLFSRSLGNNNVHAFLRMITTMCTPFYG
jgi:hypothetical protein